MGVKISELSEANSIQDTDVLAIVQNGETKKVAVDTILNAVIETGSNENGSYIKYFDGTMICYGTVTETINISTLYEGAYFGAITDKSFAQQFITAPVLTLGIKQNNSLLSSTIVNVTNSTFGVYIWKSATKSNVSVTINYQAIGRWK